MLEYYYKERRSIVDFRRGLLGPYFDRYAVYLKLKGYALDYARSILGIACLFNAFLIDQKITSCGKLSNDLTAPFFNLYFGEFPKTEQCFSRIRARRHLDILFEFLAEIKLFKPPKPKLMRTPLSWILDPYVQYLRQESSLKESTRKTATSSVREFLEAFGDDMNRGQLKRLSAAKVDSYIQKYLKESPASLSRLGTTLRRFFRYCATKDLMSADFSTLIPPVRRYRYASLPKGLEDSALDKVISSLDRNTPIGARDYAIMVLLMAYGIRGVSAAELVLNDIDWQQSRIRIRAQKGGKEVILPLLDGVGEAIVAYLRHRVSNSSHREVFLRIRAPFRPLDSVAISAISRRHLIRAGVHIAGAGTRTFRHSWAIRALAHDSPIKAIADVLGHRYIDTTYIYAKADLKTLRDVAMPWPERK